MNYNCHRVGGVTAATVTGMYIYQRHFDTFKEYILPTPFQHPHIPISLIITFLLLLTFSLIGSVILDIDLPQSVYGRKFKRISRYINQHYGHRGITHYPITILITSIVLYYLFQHIEMIHLIKSVFLWSGIGLLVGCISHIVLDLFNSKGVALFAPFSKVCIKIPTGIRFHHGIHWRYLRGDKAFDNLILVVLCVLLINVTYNKLF